MKQVNVDEVFLSLIENIGRGFLVKGWLGSEIGDDGRSILAVNFGTEFAAAVFAENSNDESFIVASISAVNYERDCTWRVWCKLDYFEYFKSTFYSELDLETLELHVEEVEENEGENRLSHEEIQNYLIQALTEINMRNKNSLIYSESAKIDQRRKTGQQYEVLPSRAFANEILMPHFAEFIQRCKGRYDIYLS